MVLKSVSYKQYNQKILLLLFTKKKKYEKAFSPIYY